MLFRSDRQVSYGTLGLTGYDNYTNNCGKYKLVTNNNSSTNAANATYTLTANDVNKTSGEIITIACDLSYYKDHDIRSYKQGKNTYYYFYEEPTLSQRVIFHVRPAAEMVAMLNPFNNATGATTENYLEEYTIIAPNDRTIRFGPKYEYSGTNSNYFIDNTTATSAGTWYLNGSAISSPTVTNNRVLAVTATNSTNTDIYTLVANGRGIAKFTIIYQPTTQVGPQATPIVNDQTLARDYEFVTGKNFDNNATNSLNWDEIGYGYSYPDWELLGTTNRYVALTCWSEYRLMNIVPQSYSNFLVTGIRDVSYLKDNTNTTGQFLYVDASTNPGLVAQLRFDNGGLCPGAHMYVSAWVNNLSKHTTPPNLNFIVMGINADGTEDQLSSYTTGDMKVGTEGGTWRQIFFEVTVPQKSYAEYRLVVINNGQNSTGNDYAIDNIEVYRQKTSLGNYQANDLCDLNNEEQLLMMRLDAATIDLNTQQRIDTIYYQYQQANGTPLSLKDYANSNTQDNFGFIRLTQKGMVPFYPVYKTDADSTGLERYAAARRAYIAKPSGNFSNIFVTEETSTTGNKIHVYYIIHSATNNFEVGNNYKCVIATSPLSLATQDKCGMINDFTILPQAKLILNRELSEGLEGAVYCANQENEIAITMYGNKGSLTEIVTGTCYFDWLLGNEQDYSNNSSFAGLNYNTIATAITHLRNEYPSVTSLTGVTAKGQLTANEITLMNTLVNRNILILYKTTISRRLLPGITHFTLFPIASTAMTDYEQPMEVCANPFAITLNATSGQPNFRIGYHRENGLPFEVKVSPRNIRVSASTANTLPLTIPICQINDLTLADIENSLVQLLPTTTDANKAPLFNNTETPTNIFTSIVTSIVNGDTLINLSNRNVNFNFEQGYKYDFVLVSETDHSEICLGNAYFSIIVVPDYVMWTPQENSNSWHCDNNWTMINANDNSISNGGSGYVPMRHTNTLIAHSNNKNVLKETTTNANQTALTLNDDAQEYIEWDLNFVANSCRNIHFNAHAELVNQHLLSYDSAWVDMVLRTNNWNLLAPPMNGIVVGDMHIPSSGNYNNPLFNDVDDPDNRTTYQFWTVMYNNEGKIINRAGNTTPVTATQWTQPFNALETAVPVATGYAVWPQGQGETEVVVRLPKANNRYYYYTSNGNITELYEDITRPANAHRLAETGNGVVQVDFSLRFNTNAETQLVANPYMTDLSIGKFWNYGNNKQSLTGQFSIIDPTTGLIENYSLNLGVSSAGSAIEYIPMHSSFLAFLDVENSSNLELTISPEMYFDANETPVIPVTKGNMATAPKNILRIEASADGYKSSCIIVEVANSQKSYNNREDGIIALLSPEMTPSAIYTLASDQALAINAVPEIDEIPLGFIVQEPKSASSLILTFTGSDDFNKELEFYDSKTNQTATITEGLRISVPQMINNDGRYYVRTKSNAPTAVDNTIEESKISLYQPINGQVYIISTAVMNSVRVYTTTGQLIQEVTGINGFNYELKLPSGVYLIDVNTEDGLYREKAVVR